MAPYVFYFTRKLRDGIISTMRLAVVTPRGARRWLAHAPPDNMSAIIYWIWMTCDV